MSITKEIKTSISFNIDDLSILSTVDEDVYVRGLDFDNDVVNECVLIIDRELFIDLINGWLDAKKTYYDQYKQFCGVGSVNITECFEVDKVKILSSNQTEFLQNFKKDENSELKYIYVNSYRVEKAIIDMERG